MALDAPKTIKDSLFGTLARLSPFDPHRDASVVTSRHGFSKNVKATVRVVPHILGE